ncbi:ammonia-forming cytochrome c nitrite reductase subunit c552 [Novipirellula herctigrandis]|uniref:ammonia-forming cytochrome c nitrite reductase subunit c552 n=1 Tax=Novipirellula herctigrandis TaxID=2527986 RepID=UPI003AF3815C
MSKNPPHAKKSLPIARLVVAGITVLVGALVFGDYWSAEPLGIEPSYVGRAACIDCHQEESELYAGSDHDLAMDLATEETVLGDFNDVTFEHDGLVNRLFRDGDRFMVRTEGEDGEMHDFHVKYVFGIRPLQNYMVEFDREEGQSEDEVARVQVLRITWDTENKEWFYLRPPDVPEKLEPNDPLHWTGIAQRWQTMCAECHSTNLQEKFDPSTAHYHTTYSEIDVSCEACHGPGSLHVDLANRNSIFWDRNYGYGLVKLKVESTQPQIQTCAPCHSRRGVLDERFRPGDNYHDFFNLERLQPSTYYDDGQIKDEVYVYGSFIQSKMYHQAVRCTDCHDPHSLKLKHSGNETCTSCHQHAAGKYDVPSHHHHEPGTPGAMCVDCHMPETRYMAIDPRRDHSMRVPRPDLSVKIGTPNSCSGCHVEDRKEKLPEELQATFDEYADWILTASEGNETVAKLIAETDKWCDDACVEWYGKERLTPPHFGETIAAFRRGEPDSVKAMVRLIGQSNELAPEIARATALAELGQAGVPEALGKANQIVTAERAQTNSVHPLVLAAAIGIYEVARPQQVIQDLFPLIDHPTRLIRTETIRVIISSGAFRELAGSRRTQVELASEQVRDSMMVAADRGGAHMGWAILLEQQGRTDEAVEAYETAIRVEPLATGARSNLAALLEGLAPRSPGEKGMQMMMRAEQLRREELPLFARDAKVAPNNAFVQYRYGLSLYLSGDMDAALEHLQKAADLEPETEQYQTAVRLIKEKMESDK